MNIKYIYTYVMSFDRMCMFLFAAKSIYVCQLLVDLFEKVDLCYPYFMRVESFLLIFVYRISLYIQHTLKHIYIHLCMKNNVYKYKTIIGMLCIYLNTTVTLVINHIIYTNNNISSFIFITKNKSITNKHRLTKNLRFNLHISRR